MEININWFAVALATFVVTLISAAWYGKIFAVSWEKSTGVTSKALAGAYGKKHYLVLLLTNLLSVIGVTLIVTTVSAYAKNTSVWLALATGFGLWLTLSATTLLQHNVFEMKSRVLTAINIAYQLVIYLTSALVVYLFQ
ncbi:MAG: DUF1761 domain-containing protein [Candidatus Saccharimonadales bacterium]